MRNKYLSWIRIAVEVLVLSLVVLIAVPMAQTAFYRSIAWVSTGKLIFSDTAPTISSGFGSTPSIVTSNGAAVFRINVGTGGTALTGIVGMPTASVGWNCQVFDFTTNTSFTQQTGTATTNVTLTNFKGAGTTTTLAWTASDILYLSCAAL